MRTLTERLKGLTEIDAVSGQEQPMVRHLLEILEHSCETVEVDVVGNVYAIRKGPKEGPTVMIAAHTDEIGLIVKSIEPTGFIRFEKLGGVLDNLLAARLVRVKGHNGVIGMKAGHYQSADERSQVRPHTEMYIDVGAGSAHEVTEWGIEIGDPITFVSSLVEFGQDGRFVAGKAVDNRLGCAILMKLIEEVEPTAGTLVAAFTSQEEVGLKGAGVAGFRIRPNLGLALDTMPSGDTPEMSEYKQLNTKLGAGPCFQVLAGPGGNGFLLSPQVKDYLVGTARKAGIPYQLVTFTGGNNDASTIAWAAEGVPAGSICLPRRYSHSPLEVADMHDAEQTYLLLKTIVSGMDGFPSLGFLGA
jgi:putative aminopeptidase FrvX